MAGKQFIYNTNVGITENYATNFFDISAIEIIAKTDLSITTKELCAEVLSEMADIYNEIQTFSENNIDEKNIFTFTSKLEETLNGVSHKYIEKISFNITDINVASNTLLRTFNFA